jgi:PD-(D/E)XK nuclease superfamily
MTALPRRKCLVTAPLTTVWASRYGALRRCILRESANSGGQIPLLPQSPRAGIGTVIHKLFERAATDAAFEFSEKAVGMAWDKAIDDLEKFLTNSEYMEGMLPIARNVPNLGLMRSRTILRILESDRPLPKAAASVGGSKFSSGKLVSKSGSVVGVPDKFHRTSAGMAIIDFKTGLSGDAQNSLRGDYEIQLRIYAALFHSMTGMWPAKLELHGLDGSIHDITFSAQLCSDILVGAEELAEQLPKITPALSNNAPGQTQAGSPSQDNCRFCAFRPACPAYLTRAFEDLPPCDGDLCGRFQGWKTLGNGQFLVELTSRTGIARVRNLPPIAHLRKALQSAIPGQQIVVFNIVKTEEANPLYSPTAFTALHAYGEEYV